MKRASEHTSAPRHKFRYACSTICGNHRTASAAGPHCFGATRTPADPGFSHRGDQWIVDPLASVTIISRTGLLAVHRRLPARQEGRLIVDVDGQPEPARSTARSRWLGIGARPLGTGPTQIEPVNDGRNNGRISAMV
ncbi:MAG: hypothetical protein L0H73_13485 [Nitrococcus sp.]|nr:hypothetical protein [Nitrococcus sp.]